MPKPFASVREWAFDAPPEELWHVVADVGSYQSWWPWLRRFEPDGGLSPDARWRCDVSPPLPYMVRFTIAFDEVRDCEFASTRITGDVMGTAELSIESVGSGSVARLESELAPTSSLLKRVAATARPVVEWGHDWVLDTGRRQFLDRSRLL